MIQVAISTDFLEAVTKLPRAQQKKVNQFVNKFRTNPKSNALNYEKIHSASNSYMRSVRVDQTYRCIVLKPEHGDVFALLYVDSHDAAYDWAQRRRCEVHPQTGVLQLFVTQTSNITPEQPTPAPIVTKPEVEKTVKSVEQQSNVLLFAEHNEKQLIKLGMPEEFKDIILGLKTVDDLQRVEKQLPVDAYEALYMVAVGLNYDEVLADYNENMANEIIDVDDYAAAIKRNGSQRKFVFVDDEALQKMLEAPLEKWRVFLHPSQRKLIERDWNGPVRVLGGAGTGKTVVAMHRAKWLAAMIPKSSNKKVLFTTFTKNLAADINAHLRQICTQAELDRIEVINIDAWVGKFISRHDHKYQIVFHNDKNVKREKCWQFAMDAKSSELDLSERFYLEEWALVVQEQGITSLKDYIKAKRTGRGTRLNRSQRMQIWPVFEEYQLQLTHMNLREMVDATKDCLTTIKSKVINPIYQSVIVDEGQDMGTHAYKLIRALVPEDQPNDIFVVGDGHQRIYRNKVVLGRCGINIRGGRSKKLRINYRTTEETRRMAVSVLEGISIDDLDDGQDDNKGYVSLMHGAIPEHKIYSSQAEEVAAIIEIIESLEAANVKRNEICLVARTNALRNTYADALQQEGFETYEIKTNGEENRDMDGIRVATMHRVKGLEFQHLFIAGANAKVIPLGYFKSDDPVELREFELSERALLHVAMTRAIKRLVITSSGEPSPFLVQGKRC